MINKATLLGRLARDPESRQLPGGGSVANLRVLTSERWKSRDSGEYQERTEGHNVAIFAEPTVRYVSNNLKKGDLIYVEGSLSTRKWQDQSGVDRYSTEIVIRPYDGKVKKVTGVGGGAQDGTQGGTETSYPSGSPQDDIPAPKPDGEPTEISDEIPF